MNAADRGARRPCRRQKVQPPGAAHVDDLVFRLNGAVPDDLGADRCNGVVHGGDDDAGRLRGGLRGVCERFPARKGRAFFEGGCRQIRHGDDPVAGGFEQMADRRSHFSETEDGNALIFGNLTHSGPHALLFIKKPSGRTPEGLRS